MASAGANAWMLKIKFTNNLRSTHCICSCTRHPSWFRHAFCNLLAWLMVPLLCSYFETVLVFCYVSVSKTRTWEWEPRHRRTTFTCSYINRSQYGNTTWRTVYAKNLSCFLIPSRDHLENFSQLSNCRIFSKSPWGVSNFPGQDELELHENNGNKIMIMLNKISSFLFTGFI
jgi:hypothetical protein